MASGRDEPRSITGLAETAEPVSTSTAQSSRDASPVLKRDTTSSTSIPALRNKTSSSLLPTVPLSTGSSPRTSRNTSPIRPTTRQDVPQAATRAGGLRSRKNSHDASPHRPPAITPPAHAMPSAAAIQRALSATSVPQLQPGPVTEAVSKLPRTSRSTVPSGESTPTTAQWPVSPRFKSPPPAAVNSRRGSALSQRKTDSSSAPPITVQSSTPPLPVQQPTSAKENAATDKDQLHAPTKAPSRGPSGPKSNLETVEEHTPPSESVLARVKGQSFSSTTSQSRTSDEDRASTAFYNSGEDTSGKPSRRGDSGESDGNRSDGKAKPRRENSATAPRHKNALTKAALSPLSSAKSRTTEGTRNMTVETETVSSIPQSALNADRSGTSRGDGGGSVRLKPSNETIRPKTNKKRTSRKAPSVHNGTASSKADIFEARVASAVDEANSSDSDETFVYESNPPEREHRVRNHSRTPSATSVQSQGDRRGGRNYGHILDSHRVAGKRSMKFLNNPYNVLDNSVDEGGGTVRAHGRHVSRLGRTMGSNPSLHDPDSPFTQASKLRTNLANSSRHGSRPTTPVTPKSAPPGNRLPAPWGPKGDLAQYDFDGEGADDERTPLVGSLRTRNGRHPRRFYSNGSRSENIYNIRHSSWMGRFGGCLLGFVVLLLIVIGASGFLVMSNKTMYDVQVRKIENVLASEQELMLDLFVGAINPNVLGVTVTDMDVNVFAKSKHLSDAQPSQVSQLPGPTALASPWREKRPGDDRDAVHVAGTPWQDPDGHWGPGDGLEPIEGDSQTMLLGRILHFDQALYFEGSPIKRHMHYSVGEMRLMKPGNKTEAGGSQRWERVLQFPFELILRGVLRYQLPISNREQSSAIAGSILVHPEEGVDAFGNMRIEEVDRSEQWQWAEAGDADGKEDENGARDGGRAQRSS